MGFRNKEKGNEEKPIYRGANHQFAQTTRGCRSTAEVCRETGITAATFYNWKAKFGGMSVSDAQPLRQLEAENVKLRRVVVGLIVDNVALKDVLSKNDETRDQA